MRRGGYQWPEVGFELGRKTMAGNEARGSPGNRPQKVVNAMCGRDIFHSPNIQLLPTFSSFLVSGGNPMTGFTNGLKMEVTCQVWAKV